MYLKVLEKNWRGLGYHFKEGLNTDIRPFDKCKLSFSDEKNVMSFVSCGDKVALVEVPEGETIVVIDNEYKAHVIIIAEIRELWTMETMEWLKSLNVDFHAANDAAFREACKKGHLEIAKWLYELGDVDIHAEDEYAFYWVCGLGHLEVAKWLYSLGGIDIHAENERAFRSACGLGELDMAKWLYSLGDVNIYAKEEDGNAFESACMGNNLSVAKWLYELGDFDIHADNDCLIRVTRKYYCTDIVEWLCGLEEANVDTNAAFQAAVKWLKKKEIEIEKEKVDEATFAAFLSDLFELENEDALSQIQHTTWEV